MHHIPHPIFLTIFCTIFGIVLAFSFFSMWRIQKVGARKFDQEAKDFFTSKEKLMLRKLEQ